MPTKILSCARCGKRVREGTYVYSRFTKNRYCIKLDECARRVANKSKRDTRVPCQHCGSPVEPEWNDCQSCGTVFG